MYLSRASGLCNPAKYAYRRCPNVSWNNAKNTLTVALAGNSAIKAEKISTSLSEHTGSISGSFTKADAVWHGWYSDAACTQLVSSNQTYTASAADLTLYAHATKNDTPAPVSMLSKTALTSRLRRSTINRRCMALADRCCYNQVRNTKRQTENRLTVQNGANWAKAPILRILIAE